MRAALAFLRKAAPEDRLSPAEARAGLRRMGLDVGTREVDTVFRQLRG